MSRDASRDSDFMSSPAPGYGTLRRLRQPSISSVSSPRLIPGSSDGREGAPSTILDVSSSYRRETHHSHGSLSSQREPARSSVHLSYRGPQAPIDSTHVPRSALPESVVRDDTASLASYGLTDRGSLRSASPLPPPRTHTPQSNHESYFNIHGSESGPAIAAERPRHETIPEISEPVSPESNPGSQPKGSMIADMLRRSPTSRSAIYESDDQDSISEEDLDEHVNTNGRLIITPDGVKRDTTERTPLLSSNGHTNGHSPRRPDWIHGEQDMEAQTKRKTSWPNVDIVKGRSVDIAKVVFNPGRWSRKAIANEIVDTVSIFPAVILGLLLNVLDALSYGQILFPLGEEIFKSLAPAGIAMFYVSTIISQLTYSCGGSIFKGGIGSEMIEVVPFFHAMASTILQEIGADKPEAVIATTITAYAFSSIVTGIAYLLIGCFKFGYIVGFIPRHILIGCIGGVGWFLVATGVEVTAGLDGNLNYDLETLKKLFHADTVLHWTIPLALAIILFRCQVFNKSKFLLPCFILSIPAVFYFFVASIDQLNLPDLRKEGWVFEGPPAGEPWWYFYTLYKFELVDWYAMAKTFPAMCALTFFGLLHAPINIPSLAFRIGEDNLDLDRELIAHGVSNALSGLAGSIQNYLVYTNSLIFIKSGGNSRKAGILLAIGTFAVMAVGGGVVGFIPNAMVGTLIYVLGMELLLEAVWDTRKKLKPLEYATVIVIVLVMGIYDFVTGIFVGIGLAFVSSVYQTSAISSIRASYSGEIAGSTVRRNPAQHRYLRDVGCQIHVTKLANFLFFGTIVSVEERIRDLIEEEAFNQRPIRFLVLDLTRVTGIDYSAAEAFNRLNRLFNKKGVTVVLSGVDTNSPIGKNLLAVGLGEDGGENGEPVDMFIELNSALESCENELLKMYYANRDARVSRHASSEDLDVPRQVKSSPSFTMDTQFSSPRTSQLHSVANRTLEETPGDRYSNYAEPLRLILQTFEGLTTENVDFWFRAKDFFVKKEYLAGTTLYNRDDSADGFYLLEEGVLRADYEIPQGRYFETIVAGTTCGELPFFSETDRTATVQVERDCVVWLMDRENWERLQKQDPPVAQEILRISLKLTSERMSTITSYVMTAAS